MLKLESLDKSFSFLESDLSKLASWLIEKVKKGEIKIKKQLDKRADFYLEIYLVKDETMKKNVLAYEFPKNFPNPNPQYTPLGEIYLNPKTIKNQSESLSYMLIHGFLHLLGYEHQSKNDTIAMETLEQRLLEEFESRP